MFYQATPVIFLFQYFKGRISFPFIEPRVLSGGLFCIAYQGFVALPLLRGYWATTVDINPPLGLNSPMTEALTG